MNFGVDDAGHDVIFYGATSGYNMMWDESSNRLEFKDNTKIYLGDGSDLQIYHTGSHSYIQNTVVGDLYIRNNADNKDIILQSDDGSGGVTAYLTLDGSTTHSYFSAGNVGIGTVTPSHKLHVDSGTTNVTSVFKSSDNQAWVSVQDDDSGTYGALFGTDTDAGHDIVLADKSANKRLVIDSSGNVGIGTTSPSTPLDVVGNIKTSTNLLADNAIVNKVTAGTSSGSIKFRNNDGADKLTILDGGNVGIGTNSPGQKLEVDEGYINVTGAGTSHGYELERDGLDTYRIRHLDGGLTIYNSTDTRKEMTFKGDGNIGIGTTSPLGLFQLDEYTVADQGSNTSHGVASIFADSGDEALYIGVKDAAYPNRGYGFRATISGVNADFTIYEKGLNGDRFTIKTGGNIGIGTTSPASLLHVAGTVQVGVDDTGHDVVFYGATSGKYMRWDESQDRLEFTDTTEVVWGTDGDLNIVHDGTDGKITEKTGHLYIRTQADDKDVILQSDDGSGGTTAYLTLDGSATTTVFAKNTRIEDSVLHQFGGGNDMAMYHNGTDSFITNSTGHLKIRQFANDKDIIFDCDDGSGGVITYLTFDGGDGHTIARKEIQFVDDVVARFGSGNDMAIRHNGSHSYVSHDGTGNLYIDNTADDADTIFRCDDGEGDTTAYLTLDGGDVSTIINTIKVLMPNLPTSDPGVAGQLWNSSGDLKISEA
jgi:hypothetical protein